MNRFRIPPITIHGRQLRDYQTDFKAGVFDAWKAGAIDVCGVLPTGAGKTVCLASIVNDFSLAGIPSMVVAHRQELVSQISLALACEGITHNIIASKPTIRFASNRHVEVIGRSHYHPQAVVTVSSVDTLIRRDVSLLVPKIGLYVTDECHHFSSKGGESPNKWMKCRQMFHNALGLGVTATPDRADGAGLGRHADGPFDCIVEGPQMRELIRRGYLTDYRVFCPPSDLDLSAIEIGGDGDYKTDQLKAASKKSHIVGDVVDHYKRVGGGRRGVTFAISVDDAEEICAQFNASGVPARTLTGYNTDTERAESVRMLETGEILQLVSVGVITEGFDLPAIEVISFARPTNSYSLFIQMFGRALRPAPGKDRALILDHVGNVERFIQKGRGLPDTPQQWSLDRRERGARTVQPADVMQLTTCLECFAAYDSHLSACPWCGAAPVVGEGGRSGPERVEGELYEMDPGLMAQLRGEADRILAPDYPEQVRLDMLAKHAPSVGVHTAVKRAGMQQAAQSELRGRMARWMSVWERAGLPVADVRGMFKQVFGVDYLTAQTLPAKGAEELAGRLDASLREYGAQ